VKKTIYSKINKGNSYLYLQTGEVAKPWTRGEMDMVQTFKIVNGIDKVNSQDWFTKAVNQGTRSTSGLDNLVKPRSEHEYRRHFFSQRVVDERNSLPNHVKEARKVPCFRRFYRLTAGPA
jgi:hypothetical protein